MARQATVSGASLSYAVLFIGLYLVAHLITRFALPAADPYLLPLAALLTGIGLTEIYRIDPDLALRQGIWIVVGLALYAVLALVVRDYRRLDGVKYILGVTAIVLLLLPALPVVGQTIYGATLWVKVGPITFQPGEIAKVFFVIFLAGYLRDNREMLSGGLTRFGMPSLKHLGPLLVIWGAAMLVLFVTNDLGGGLLYFSVFLAMLYVATGRWAYVGRRPPPLCRRRLRPLSRRSARPGSSQHLAESLGRPVRQRLPARPVDLRDLGRRALRDRARSRRPDRPERPPLHPLPADRLHLLGDLAGARTRRSRGGDPPLRPGDLPGLQDRDARR